MSWGEFVHVTAEYFEQGEYPWTDEDFYNNSVLQRDAAPTIDPIVHALYDWEGPRVAENDSWWDREGVWWGKTGSEWAFDRYLPLDDDLRLIDSAVRFRFIPLTTRSGDKKEPPRAMLHYECDNGIEETFGGHLDDLKALCDQHRKAGQSYIALLTLWTCDAGDCYVPGEPTEYYSDWQLIGAITPKADGVLYQALLPTTPARVGEEEGNQNESSR